MKKALLFCFALYSFQNLRAQNDISFQACATFWLNDAPVLADSANLYVKAPNQSVQTFPVTDASCVTGTIPDNVFPADVTLSMDAGKDGDDLNGVTLVDVAIIYNHILGIQPLASTYKLVAADVNRSGSITVFDIAEIQKLLAGIYTEFPNNMSWRFILANCVPPTPGVDCPPLTVNDPAQIQNPVLPLKGVKIGDVDGDANPLSAFAGPDIAGLTMLQAPNVLLPAGVPTTVAIKLGGTQTMAGVQMEFLYNSDVVQLTGAEGNGVFLESFFGNTSGKFIALGVDPDGNVVPGQTLVQLTFTANTDVHLLDVLSLNTDIRHSVAVIRENDQFRALQLGLTQEASSGTVSAAPAQWMLAPYPNPFNEQSTFTLQLEQEENVRLEIFDASGKRLYVSENTVPSGVHALNIPQTTLLSGTVGYYRLQAGKNLASGKLTRL